MRNIVILTITAFALQGCVPILAGGLIYEYMRGEENNHQAQAEACGGKVVGNKVLCKDGKWVK